MSLVKVTDLSGKTINLVEWEDRYYPPFPVQNIMGVPKLKLRDDDVFLCSYSKSGTHWMSEICRMLMFRNPDIETKPKTEFMVELQSHEKLDEVPSPRLLNTHYIFDRMPADITAKKNKIVYIRRNPKDVLVSSFFHVQMLNKFYEYDGDFNGYFELFMNGTVEYGSWFDYVTSWEKIISDHPEIPILECVYEDLKEDPIREVRRVSDFLGVERDEELIKKIVERCHIDLMRERFKGTMPGIPNGHEVFCRKGKVGDWKNWFTVAQNDRFDRVYKEKMAGSQLKFKFTLNTQ